MSWFSSRAHIPAVSAVAAHVLVEHEHAMLLDVGAPHEWALGHLPGAHLLHYDGAFDYELIRTTASTSVVILGCRNQQRGAEFVSDLRAHAIDAMLLDRGPWAWEHAGFGLVGATNGAQFIQTPS